VFEIAVYLFQIKPLCW